jgi:hypothetical protein
MTSPPSAQAFDRPQINKLQHATVKNIERRKQLMKKLGKK